MTSYSLKMAALHSFQFSIMRTIVIFLSYFSLDFDWVCGTLHDLVRTCISDSLAVNVAVPYN